MRFVLVTDRRFFIGTAVLMFSLVERADIADIAFLVIHDGLQRSEVEYLERICPRIEFIDRRQITNLNLPSGRLPQEKIGRLKKLSMFGISPGETLCYLDSDMICVGRLEELLRFEHWSVALDMGRRVFANVAGYPMFNSGVIVFRSSLEFSAELRDFAKPHHFENKADQWLLNDFMYTRHPADIRIIHSVYNTPVSLGGSNPRIFDDLRRMGLRIVHFTNTKPWQNLKGLSGLKASVKEFRDRWKANAEFADWHRVRERMRAGHGEPTCKEAVQFQ